MSFTKGHIPNHSGEHTTAELIRELAQIQQIKAMLKKNNLMQYESFVVVVRRKPKMNTGQRLIEIEAKIKELQEHSEPFNEILKEWGSTARWHNFGPSEIEKRLIKPSQ